MNAKIIERCEHLLMEILVLLPPKSIFRFMCVSKRWNNIINDPFFLQSYSRRHRSCSAAAGGGRLIALFQRTLKPYADEHCSHHRPMNILPIRRTGYYSIKYVPRRFGLFVNSSNGLILCRVHPAKFYVLNPVTKKWALLPPPPPPPLPENNLKSVGLMCEENTSKLIASYIVVRAYHRANILQIQTYSSKNGEWTESTLVGADYLGLPFEPPLVVNGVFHWDTVSSTIVVYDPNDGKNHLQLIELPYDSYMSHIITRSPDDILWLGHLGIVEEPKSLQFWMLPKGEDGSYRRDKTIPHKEWILMYNIIPESLLENIGSVIKIEEFEYISARISIGEIHLEAFISWNPIVVLMRKRGTWLLYNLESESCELVRYHGRNIHCPRLYQSRLCPFLESTFLSSYAL